MIFNAIQCFFNEMEYIVYHASILICEGFLVTQIQKTIDFRFTRALWSVWAGQTPKPTRVRA